MKNILSLVSCFLICAVLVQYRVVNSDLRGKPPLKITVWDAFGYNVYLPAILIYNDCRELKWLDSIDKKYSVTGGNGWQAERLPDGKYTFKYLGGVAVLQLPFFAAGHVIAKATGSPQDGFSPPYQYALGFGIIVYTLLALLLLRKILLYYFSDTVTTMTLVLLALATNFIQYAAVDSGQSHAYIFLLYVIVLYTTLKWHQRPTLLYALATGYVIGLATMSRPTEAIMLFIPLLWSTQNKEAAREKWTMVKANKRHIYLALFGGLLGILPQLIYWKITTGGFLYDVGSKWDFLNPHFRVLFGWEKGWFIYTPITVFFIVGMFFMKRFPFYRSAIVFCLLNIYIIIGWHEWRYGGSYSTRALVQSYPVFALPFAALIDEVSRRKWKWVFYAACAYLLFVNLFQVNQYNKTILHYDDMNRKYYVRIYLNAHPTPIDISVLDSNEVIQETKYRSTRIANIDSTTHVVFDAWSIANLLNIAIPAKASEETWVKVQADIKAPGSLWQTFLNAEVIAGTESTHGRVRLFSPISEQDSLNHYAFYVRVPKAAQLASLRLYLSSPSNFKGEVQKLTVTEFFK